MPNQNQLPEDSDLWVSSSSALNKVICKICQNLRLPNRKCTYCYANGLSYRGMKLKSPITVKVVRSRHELEEKLYKEQRKTTRDRKSGRYRYKSVLGRRRRRATQIAQLTDVLARVYDCFERGYIGPWLIYEDQMEKLSPILDEISKFLPDLQAELAHFKSRKTK